MARINYREKVMELEGVTDFQEIKTQEGFTCKLMYQGMQWRQFIKYNLPYTEKYESVWMLYAKFYQELTMTPMERKARKAFSDAWMKNVIEGRADSRGEFVPSTKQIIEELNKVDG